MRTNENASGSVRVSGWNASEWVRGWGSARENVSEWEWLSESKWMPERERASEWVECKWVTESGSRWVRQRECEQVYERVRASKWVGVRIRASEQVSGNASECEYEQENASAQVLIRLQYACISFHLLFVPRGRTYVSVINRNSFLWFIGPALGYTINRQRSVNNQRWQHRTIHWWWELGSVWPNLNHVNSQRW